MLTIFLVYKFVQLEEITQEKPEICGDKFEPSYEPTFEAAVFRPGDNAQLDV